MTCQRFEERLSAYLEGKLATAEKAEVDVHLAACPDCAALLALMKEMAVAMTDFPEAEPSPALLSSLYAIPAAKREKRKFFRPALDWLTRPALQPVYAAFTVLFVAVSFVLFHPGGRGIRKQFDLTFHRGIGTVEKLYAGAGSLKSDVGSFAGNVVKSIKTLDLLKGGEGIQ
ncbi:MAG: zf-HC2 domain-containing protein [Candidatus Aminicenantes bacterium]|nr:zf-HC2 domain-containing protein [Candidatus Aminicenantes bacterium]